MIVTTTVLAGVSLHLESGLCKGAVGARIKVRVKVRGTRGGVYATCIYRTVQDQGQSQGDELMT